MCWRWRLHMKTEFCSAHMSMTPNPFLFLPLTPVREVAEEGWRRAIVSWYSINFELFPFSALENTTTNHSSFFSIIGLLQFFWGACRFFEKPYPSMITSDGPASGPRRLRLSQSRFIPSQAALPMYSQAALYLFPFIAALYLGAFNYLKLLCGAAFGFRALFAFQISMLCFFLQGTFCVWAVVACCLWLWSYSFRQTETRLFNLQ